jgi:opacity protein-like surface antigen
MLRLRSLLALTAVTTGVLVSSAALADDAPPPATTETTTTTTTTTTTAAPARQSGFEHGLRTGYGIAQGDAAKDAKMSDGIKGQVPIWLDVGYRINPNIYAGVYFSYGFAMLNKDNFCKNGADCSASDMRFGVNAQYHIMPDQSFDPWVGIGIGYEIASAKISAGGADFKTTYSGLEFVNLQVGGDFKVAPNLAVGPFVALSVAQYSKASTDPELPGANSDIQDKAIHEWLTIGLRGTFGL